MKRTLYGVLAVVIVVIVAIVINLIPRGLKKEERTGNYSDYRTKSYNLQNAYSDL